MPADRRWRPGGADGMPDFSGTTIGKESADDEAVARVAAHQMASHFGRAIGGGIVEDEEFLP